MLTDARVNLTVAESMFSSAMLIVKFTDVLDVVVFAGYRIVTAGTLAIVNNTCSLVLVFPAESFTKNLAVYWPSAKEELKVFQLPDLFVNV